MSDVLVCGISEQAKLRAVGPQDTRIGTNLVDTLGGVLEEIGQLFLTERKRFFGFLASRLLALEHLRFVLQVSDRATTLLGTCEFWITLGRHRVRVLSANLQEERFVGAFGELV